MDLVSQETAEILCPLPWASTLHPAAGWSGKAPGISGSSVCPQGWGRMGQMRILGKFRLSTRNVGFFGVEVPQRVGDGLGASGWWRAGTVA